MKPLATLVAAMALALATAGPAQAGIQLTKILPVPGVVPVGQSKANAEYVVVHNTAAKAKNIRGWVHPREEAQAATGQGLRLLSRYAAGSGGFTWSTSRSIVVPSG